MNKIRIKDLEAQKLEAQQKISYLENYTSGRDFSDVVDEHKLIELNKQTIIHIEGLIKKLSN